MKNQGPFMSTLLDDILSIILYYRIYLQFLLNALVIREAFATISLLTLSPKIQVTRLSKTRPMIICWRFFTVTINGILP